MSEKILLTPGPINTTFQVKSQTLIDYGSRDFAFMDKLKEIKPLLFKLMNISTENKLILLQGSGTYATEAVLTSITEKILILINGAYGIRMKKIMEYTNKPFSFLTYDEGTEINYDDVENYLSKNEDIKYIAFVHLETSTGILNNLDRMKKISEKYNKKLIIDAIASFGSDIFDYNNCEYVITSCNKCLSGIPGFALVITKNFSDFKSPSYVLDLLDQEKNFEKTGQFRFTPPTHVLVAFHAALLELENETLEKRAKRFKSMKDIVYNMCKELGISPLIDVSKYATGNICHTFLAPKNENYNFKLLYDTLANLGFLIYPGKLTNVDSFRIGTIGCIDENDMNNFVSYFKLIWNNMLNKVETKIEPIDTKQFYDYLIGKEIEFFTGVPDSLLQEINNCILENAKNHYVMPNEGLALSLASGYYTSTSKIPCVYLQNSGLGNITNPLMSLAHKNVYSIPILCIIGWRGEPGVKDEPQHMSQGSCMVNLIRSMGFELVYLDKLNWKNNIDKCIELIKLTKQPVFLVVRKGYFKKYPMAEFKYNNLSLIRRDVIKKLVIASNDNDILCCTTGKSSRELNEEAEANKINKSRLFLMVGSMGHLSSFCLGISMFSKNKKIWCIDGDGALLMHFGAIPMIGHIKPDNLIHILLNNAMHESVGIQPTICQNIDFETIAKNLGYVNVFTIKNDSELDEFLKKVHDLKGLTFAHVLLSNKPSVSDNLSRPKDTPLERLHNLMDFIKKDN